tara:strand:- start:1808 stop:3124 length:1317 start_codon:yes stop_codon:yes gene_type:complete
MLKLFKVQKKLLIKFKELCKKKKKLNLYNYCSLGAESLGALKFKFQIDKRKYLICFLKERIKEVYGLGLIKKIRIIKDNNPEKFENIILNWAFKNDFQKHFYDKYFNINSKNYNKILWLLVYMSNEIPKNFPKNTFVVQIKKNKKFKFLSLILNLIFLIRFSDSPIFLRIFDFSQQVFLSTFLTKAFTQNKDYKKIKRFFLPYEAQLFQKKLIFNLKKKFKNLRIIGYDHTAPQPMPINIFYDKFSPDYLLVGSKNKLKFNHNYLGWPKNKMKVMKSLRFKLDKQEFRNKVLLPYIIKNKKIYLQNVIRLMQQLNLKKFKNSNVKIHPACKNKKNHIKLVNHIRLLKNKSFNKKKETSKNFVIFLGQTTAIPLAVENGLKTFNICIEPKYDVYNPKIWTGLTCKSLNDFTYQYKIKNKSALIWIDRKRNSFKNIINNF